jgi:hypothetical protein
MFPNDMVLTLAFHFPARINKWHQTGLLAIQHNPDTRLEDYVSNRKYVLEQSQSWQEPNV